MTSSKNYLPFEIHTFFSFFFSVKTVFAATKIQTTVRVFGTVSEDLTNFGIICNRIWHTLTENYFHIWGIPDKKTKPGKLYMIPQGFWVC